jgi:hypothetical protein
VCVSRFLKFASGDRIIGTQMKATGEVMAIDRCFEAAIQKAVRSLEFGRRTLLWEDPKWERGTNINACKVACHRNPLKGEAEIKIEVLNPSLKVNLDLNLTI